MNSSRFPLKPLIIGEEWLAWTGPNGLSTGGVVDHVVCCGGDGVEVIDWLGIGAQRSGTTWFTDLLVQHPQVSLGVSNRKELHLLDRSIGSLDQDQLCLAYAEEFPPDPALRGEFTPSYLRSLWAPDLAARVLVPSVLIVILRDPIDRFHSAMRFNRARLANKSGAGQKLERFIRKASTEEESTLLSEYARDAQWAGMYGPQLRAWTKAMGADRIEVIQYESLCLDPQAHVGRIWERMGLESVPLVAVDEPSGMVMSEDWLEPDRLVDLNRQLASLYRTQVSELKEFGIDGSLWKSLSEWTS